MAKNFRRVAVAENKFVAANVWTPILRYAPYDNDQTPGGYLKSVKASIIGIPDDGVLIGLSRDDHPEASTDIITCGGCQDGGTVWLSAKCSIKSGAEEDDRNDGVVYVVVRTKNNTGITADVVVESWGSYLEQALL